MTETDVVLEVNASMPAEVRARVRGVAVMFKDRPERLDLSRGCAPTQRAYFYGTPAGGEDDGSTALPDESPAEGVIVIFRANFPGGMSVAELRKVLQHEIAHALGCEEDEMECLGLAAS